MKDTHTTASQAPASARPEAAGAEPHAGSRGRLAQSRLVLPAVMILSGIVSVQAGAGVADKLFGQIPPAAVTGLRLWTSAVAMAVISGRGLARAFGDLVKRRAWADGGIAGSFGISLLIMNFSIYQSFSRIPLGVAVTIEFLGPLAVAVAGSRHVKDVGWVVLAGTGVVLLTQGGHGHLNLTGVLFAAVAGACWAAYIMLSSATGRRFPGSAGLTIAMVVAAIGITPPAVIAGGAATLPASGAGHRGGDRHPLLGHPLPAGTGSPAADADAVVRRVDEPGARGGGAGRAGPARPGPERGRVAGDRLRDDRLRRGGGRRSTIRGVLDSWISRLEAARFARPVLAPTAASMRRLALAGVIADVAIMSTGAAVRLSSSGLGCPDWPKCSSADVVASKNAGQTLLNTWIEFGNRLLNFPLVVITVLVFVAAWRFRPQGKRRRDLVWLAAVQPVGVFAQAAIGGIVVLTKLNPVTVSIHFLVSASIVAAAVVLHVRCTEGNDPPTTVVRRDLFLLSAGLVAVTSVMLAAGTVVTGTGPLAGHADTPRYKLPLEGVTQLHADIGWLLAGLAIALVVGLRMSGAPGKVVRASWVMIASLGVQGVIGYIQYFTHLPAGLVWVHVTGSVLVWVAVLRLFLFMRDRGPLTRPSPEPVQAAPYRQAEPLDR